MWDIARICFLGAGSATERPKRKLIVRFAHLFMRGGGNASGREGTAFGQGDQAVAESAASRNPLLKSLVLRTTGICPTKFINFGFKFRGYRLNIRKCCL